MEQTTQSQVTSHRHHQMLSCVGGTLLCHFSVLILSPIPLPIFLYRFFSSRRVFLVFYHTLSCNSDFYIPHYYFILLCLFTSSLHFIPPSLHLSGDGLAMWTSIHIRYGCGFQRTVQKTCSAPNSFRIRGAAAEDTREESSTVDRRT